MVLSVFTTAGVGHLRVQREADVNSLGDLLLNSLDELKEIAAERGGVRQLLDKKWHKVYSVADLRGLFISSERHAE